MFPTGPGEIGSDLFSNDKKRRNAICEWSSRRSKTEFVEAFSADANILAFAKHFCNLSTKQGRFCSDILTECLTQDKSEMLTMTYIEIFYLLENLSKLKTTLPVQNFLLLEAYYAGSVYSNIKRREGKRNQHDEPLISPLFLSKISYRLREHFSTTVHESKLKKYFKGGFRSVILDSSNLAGDKPEEMIQLSAFMTYHHVPTPGNTFE